MVASFNGSFDIRNFTDKLTPSHKGKNYYICPGCGGSSLHINPDKGAYKCFSNGCESKIIREAVAPSGKPPAAKPVAKPAKTKPRMKPVVAPVALLRQPRPITAGEYKGKQYQIKYKYLDTQYVVRYEYQKNGQREKYFTPHHIDSDGVVRAKKGDKPWPLYNSLDIEMWGGGNWINEAEGEKNADYLVSIGIVACSVTGTASEADIRYGYQQAISSGMMGIIYHQDNDLAGENKAKKHKKIADDMGIPFIICPAKELYPDIKEKGDIADLIADGKVTKESLVAFLDNKIKEFVENDQEPLLTLAVDNTKPSEDPTVTFNQIALKALFDDSYRCVNEKFYQWQGKYHKELDSALILKRIRDFCNSYLIYVENKEGKIEIKYPFANTKSVNEVFNWAKISLAVSYEDFSKTVGINCLNGVLTFDWEGNKPTPKLELHDPTKHFFTADPTIEYNPNADTTHCDKLLQSLDPASKEIILRTLAASFDFKKVRELKGRLVRILFLIGSGSNGKDAIGSVINEIFPKAVSSFGLDRFIAYDQGNLNALAGLEKSRINWASESSRTTRIDNSKSLKCLVTGEKLEARYLYQNSQEYEPNTIGLFNLNEMPNLFGTGEAASSRFAPIMFRKTFVRPEKYDPSNPNQLLADSRFKYDIGFIRSEVAPAFLNYMIKGLQDLIADGIDYSCTEEALDQVRSENNHLFDAISEMGWRYDPNASLIRISTLYDQLEAWYIEQGILTKGDFGRNNWQDPVRPSDQYITGSNRLFDRLKAIFPDIERQMKTPLGHSKRVPHIKGISVIFDKPWQSVIPTPTHAYTEPTHAPTHEPTHDGNTSNQDTVRVSPTTPTPSTHDFSKSSQKNFKEELDPNFCADPSLSIPKNSVGDDGTEENKKESLGQSWVGGVGSTPETLTTQGLQPLQTGVGSWVGTGVGTGVGSTNVPSNAPTAPPSIRMQLGEFKIGDRIQIEPQAIPGYSKIAPIIADIVMVYEGVDGWEIIYYEYQVWNKQDQKYEPIGGELGRGAVLSGWVKTLS